MQTPDIVAFLSVLSRNELKKEVLRYFIKNAAINNLTFFLYHKTVCVTIFYKYTFNLRRIVNEKI